MEQLGFDWVADVCGGVVVGGYALNWADFWIGIHWGLDWSDTRFVPSDPKPTENVTAESCLDGVDGELFHMEQLGDGVPGTDSDLGGEVDRLVGLATELGDEFAGDNLVELRARMFAHEVNNLVMSISGRAQRGLISGEPGHVSVALHMAAEMGARVASLCEIFMSTPGVDEGTGKPDNLLRGEGAGFNSRGLSDSEVFVPLELTGGLGAPELFAANRFAGGLSEVEVLAAHRFAVDIVGEHPVLVGGGAESGGVEFLVDLEEGGCGDGLPLTGMLLGQVLVNLYGNALDGIGRAGDGGGEIRLSVRKLGDGVELVVEDSGCGFLKRGNGQWAVGNGGREEGMKKEGGENDNENREPSPQPSPIRMGEGGRSGDVGSLSGGGHGLGLGVCRAICGGFGGRVVVGESEEFGGGRVSVVFG